MMMKSYNGLIIHLAVLLSVTYISACGDNVQPQNTAPSSLVSSDYLTTLTEIQPCQISLGATGAYGLESEVYVRLLINETGAAHYTDCVVPESLCEDGFPEGSLLVQPRYFDPTCQQPIGVSAVLKSPVAQDTDEYGWHWQDLSSGLNVRRDGNLTDCVNCHSATCSPPYGHDLRCLYSPHSRE